MGKYYCLIAGLPNIALDDSKLTYSISQFRQELDGILTKADKKLIDLFFLKFDNKNLIAHAKQPDRDPDPRGRITYDEFDALYKALKEEEKPPKNDRIPPYFKEFSSFILKHKAKKTNRKFPGKTVWQPSIMRMP